jgi:hypothetical protein
MALDIERLEWWISSKHLEMKLKQSLEEINKEKTLCEILKTKKQNNDKDDKTNHENQAK